MNKETPEMYTTMTTLGHAARRAATQLAATNAAQRDTALSAMAAAIRDNAAEILAANAIDVEEAKSGGLAPAMIDRLLLDEQRVAAMAAGIESIVKLPDPIGKVLAEWQRPNGLKIQRLTVPLGVIGIIYESRPNVTADAAALCLKSGNAVILRGGSESFRSNHAIYDCLRDALDAARIPPDSIQMVATRDRAAVGYLLSSMGEWLDVVIPRGGKRLIKRVQDEARVPVIGHLEGICHVYLHRAANSEMARDIVVNAKMRRTGICGSAETVLVDRAVAAQILPGVCKALQDAGCEIRGDDAVCQIVGGAQPAAGEDWSTEYLDAIISIRIVDDLAAAVDHIGRYGSGHTEAIVTDDSDAADRFFHTVDSAILLHNASTQFADGGEFGMGAEIGIATGRIHARGPVGAEQLTSYKYVVRGNGQTRP